MTTLASNRQRIARRRKGDVSAFVPIGDHAQNSSLSSAVTLNAPAGATKLVIQTVTQNCRYTLDGSTVPTSTLGFRLQASEGPVTISTTQSVRIIQETAGAVIDYQWGI